MAKIQSLTLCPPREERFSVKRIIIIDDEDLMRYSLTTAFRNETTEVLAVPDGRTALQVLNMADFDLCFLDVHLPDMNGLTIMDRLRSEAPGTRIIIMTGSEVSDAMFKTIRENAHALLEKPFELDQLKLFVKRMLAPEGPLSWDESTAIKNSMPSLKWVAEDFRKNERRPLSCRITCFTAGAPGADPATPVAAEVLDISEHGMCIITENSLEPGNILLFNDSPYRSTGVVRWSMSAGKENAYRAGIQFVTREGAA
jgi:CheY-like chemotaxis protein